MSLPYSHFTQLFMCMGVLPACLWTKCVWCWERPGEGIRLPVTWVTGGCELWLLELRLGLLLLTAEPSLQPVSKANLVHFAVIPQSFQYSAESLLYGLVVLIQYYFRHTSDLGSLNPFLKFPSGLCCSTQCSELCVACYQVSFLTPDLFLVNICQKHSSNADTFATTDHSKL